MANTRRSSRSQAATATSASATVAHPEPDDATPETAKGASPTPDAAVASSSVDSTHQANETLHVKQDQALEASDPDMLSATTEQLNEAVTTPINTEVQEEEPLSSFLNDESSGAEHSGGHSHQNDHKDAGEEHAKDASEEGHKEPEHSIHLVSHIKGVPGHAHDNEDSYNKPVETHVDARNDVHDEALSSHASDKRAHKPYEEHHESTKHAMKRSVDADSNTVAEEHHDYSAGVYKSPYRHTHKAEKAGKEER